MPQIQNFLDISQNYLSNEKNPAQKVHNSTIHEHAETGRKSTVTGNNNNGCYMWLKKPHTQ